jgi:hypothetical protein
MWARALPSAGELWLFDDHQRWGDVGWAAHLHWRRLDGDEVRISGLKSESYCRAARGAIFAELGRLGFTWASWIRMKNGEPLIIRKRIEMAKAAGYDVEIKISVKRSGTADVFSRTTQEYVGLPYGDLVAVQKAIADGLIALGEAKAAE